MNPIKIATAQFETTDNDKAANLSSIRDICLKASVEGADLIFMPHVTMYTPSPRPGAECRKLGNDFTIAAIISEKLQQAGSYRCRKARRPELYADIIGQPHTSEQKISCLNTNL